MQTVQLAWIRKLSIMAAVVAMAAAGAHAQATASEACPRPGAGSSVAEPHDLRSTDGILRVNLTFRNELASNGQMRYCYVAADGSPSPNLRLKPGDLLILNLKNELTIRSEPMPMGGHRSPAADPCTSAKMTSASTNLHFHGLSIPPVCHQDDVLKTSVQPGDAPFEYRVRIPANQVPGLYWYHPHLHGFSKVQVLGGASGALIVEGIERANSEVSGLPERVLVIRDQDLLNPTAVPARADSQQTPPVVLDRDGDAMNTGTGTGKPAKDLSVNFVPAPYPDYQPAILKMKPAKKELWRVLNASAITYLNLQVLYMGAAQMLGVVAIDGVPIYRSGHGGASVVWQNHLGVPPGGRVEFVLNGPATGVQARLITRSVNTGPGGENDPTRPLAAIIGSDDAPEPRSTLVASADQFLPTTETWLGNIAPVRTRKLYFSEKLQDPTDPNSPTTFYMTVEGQVPVPFDPNSTVPNITVRQGDVEDWIIENRSNEQHAFHIHQVHFLLMEWFGVPVNEPFLRDTVNVPFWDGKIIQYPTVKLRMDFRDPNIVGIFPYHCHLLEHEDGGMMGLIRVDPRAGSVADGAANKP
jgi:FtsP/CotA-like multicopper oxidase with cupredoxin domain